MTGQVAILKALNTQIDQIATVVVEHFGRHPDAEIYASQPGLGVVLSARVLGEFGDDPTRYADAKARKNYAGTSPITRPSGNRRLSWPATQATDDSLTPSSNGRCEPPRDVRRLH